MKFTKRTLLSLLAMSSFVSAGVMGTLVDEEGAPIVGADITLSSGGTAVSDDLGMFRIGEVGISDGVVSQQSSSYTLQIVNKAIAITVTEYSSVSLNLIDLKGRAISLYNGALSSGVHSLPFSISPAAGVWILQGSIGDNAISQKLVVTESANISLQSGGLSSIATNQSQLRTVSRASDRSTEVVLFKKGFFTDTLAFDGDQKNFGTVVMKKPVGWGFDSHDKGGNTNYELLFPDEKVNRIDITMSEADWHVVNDDMTARYGQFTPWSGAPSVYIGNPIGGLTENPVYVPATVEFNGEEWTKVGFRFKGNSTLSGSWVDKRSLACPMKLDFDEFEQEYPEINDQRFYGVRQLTMYNHHGEESCLKEKIVGDLMRDAGVAVPHRSYYEVYVNFGSGAQYFGLYTAIEAPWGDYMRSTFGDTDIDGNIYKPEAPMSEALRRAARFQDNAIYNDKTFSKKSNELSDWSDIEAIVSILHSSSRTWDPAGWRGDLEAVFNVNGFLNYLAVSNTLGLNDLYGLAAHNYYLYGDPLNNGRINWIAYDLNFSMDLANSGMSMSMDEITDTWPLIRFLMDDPIFSERYWEYVVQFKNNQFDETKMLTELQRLHNMISPYVTSEEVNYSIYEPVGSSSSELSFDSFINGEYHAIKQFVTTRQAQVADAITNK